VYLLDTDHLSILQRAISQHRVSLTERLNRIDPGAVFVSIVSFHEQSVGCNAFIDRARDARDVLRGYEMQMTLLRDFVRLNVAGFDSAANTKFAELRSQRVRVGTIDLRIASIALSRG
jgi:tRNA(fMet)-specific endonuclease VapC